MSQPPVSGTIPSSGPTANREHTVFQTVTEKVSDGLRLVASQIEGGVEQLRATDSGPLASVAPTLNEYGHQAARALERSADYVADLDLEQLKADATTKIQNNPGKSLLIAVGVGFILGGILKKKGL